MAVSMGLYDDTWQRLKQTVNVTIHTASTINLLSRLEKMTHSVIEPTLVLTDFCLNCKQLNRFVYVSTAYSNAHLWQKTDALDVEVKEGIYDLSSETEFGPQAQASLDEIRRSGTSQEYRSNDFPWSYAYAKHLTERLVSHKFATHGANDKLLIVRPSVICPAIDKPHPGYCSPASAPSTLFAASIMLYPGRRVVMAARSKNPMKETNIDEVPVDVVVDRLLVHLALGTAGCIHAVRGPTERFRFGVCWNALRQERRFLWPVKPVWKPVDWHSPKIHPAARLFKIIGASFAFSQDRTIEACKQLSDDERRDLRLFVPPGESYSLASRMDDVHQMALVLAKKKKIPLWLVTFLCPKKGCERGSFESKVRGG